MLLTLAAAPAPELPPLGPVADLNPAAYDAGFSALFRISAASDSGYPLWIGDDSAAEVAGSLLFAGRDGAAGVELWRTDGTPAGTGRVADLFPGARSSAPRQFLAVPGGALFIADDGSSGAELWWTDGTPGGTRLAKDIVPGAADALLSGPMRAGGIVYVLASVGGDGQLWRTDGTPAGTTRVRAGLPPNSSPISHWTAVGDLLLVAAGDGAGHGLWRSDGTPAGTARLLDAGDGYVSALAGTGGQALFVVSTLSGATVWRSDGSPDGTAQLADLGAGWVSDLTAAGTGAFFIRHRTDSNQAELWRSDGTLAGTLLLHVYDDQQPARLTPLGGALLYGANSYATQPPSTGSLWRSDGTPAGTRAIAVLDGPIVSSLSAGDTAFFLTRPGSLWATDGTGPGTTLVGTTGIAYAYDVALHALGQQVLVRGPQGGTASLWRSGRTAGSLALVRAGVAQSGSSDIRSLTPVRGGALAVISDPPPSLSSDRLWRTDGSPGGTVAVPQAPLPVTPLAPLAGFALFGGYDEPDSGLWRTDGTPTGTALVAPLSTSALATDGAWAYVAGTDQLVSTVYRTDGQPGSLTPLGSPTCTPTLPQFSCYDTVDALLPLGGRVLVSVQHVPDCCHNSHNIIHELWVADARGGGMSLVRQFGTSYWSRSGALPPALDDLTIAGGLAYFRARDTVLWDGPLINSLWRSDGTLAGTVTLATPGDVRSPDSLTPLGSRLLFVMGDAAHGRELWRTDGTPAGTAMVADIAPGAADSDPQDLTVSGGTAFFSAYHPDYGRELWRTDGTPAGTRLVRDVMPGTAGAVPSSLADARGTLVFSAADLAHGAELWRSDGTTSGTVMVADIAAGDASANPEAFTIAAGQLLFTADDGQRGRELWAVRGVAATIEGEDTPLQSWLDGVSYQFPANALPQGAVVTHTALAPELVAPAAGRVILPEVFAISARQSASGAALQPAGSYTVTVRLTPEDLARVREGTLGLYVWDGSDWIPEPSMHVDVAGRAIMAAPSRFGQWAVIGEERRLWLPTVSR